MIEKIKYYGFWAAGLANISGVLLASMFFTNPVLSQTDPVVMSNFGLVCIILWGLAYIAVAGRYQQLTALVSVFAIEKLVYVVAWCCWYSGFNGDWQQLYSDSFLAGVFFTIYGLNDFLFMLFFAWVAADQLRQKDTINPF